MGVDGNTGKAGADEEEAWGVDISIGGSVSTISVSGIDGDVPAMLQVLQEEETTPLDWSKVYNTALDGSEDAIRAFLNVQQASQMWLNAIIALSNVFYW